MIPDKIYIGTVTLSSNAPSEEHLLPDWHLRPNPKIANVEYIRKDALIEWANEHYTSLDITKRDMWDGGYNCAIKELIDKLNSL